MPSVVSKTHPSSYRISSPSLHLLVNPSHRPDSGREGATQTGHRDGAGQTAGGWWGSDGGLVETFTGAVMCLPLCGSTLELACAFLACGYLTWEQPRVCCPAGITPFPPSYDILPGSTTADGTTPSGRDHQDHWTVREICPWDAMVYRWRQPSNQACR